MTRAFVGLGSNLGDREALIARAVDAVGALRGTSVRALSRLRETEPVGITAQPRFLNGVLAVDTSLAPRSLLDALLEIENSLGRDREGVPPGGPRTIDLDLLLYGKCRISEPGLELPHPRLHERRFVLEPLHELAPTLEVPGRGDVARLLTAIDSPGV